MWITILWSTISSFKPCLTLVAFSNCSLLFRTWNYPISLIRSWLFDKMDVISLRQSSKFLGKPWCQDLIPSVHTHIYCMQLHLLSSNWFDFFLNFFDLSFDCPMMPCVFSLFVSQIRNKHTAIHREIGESVTDSHH